MANDDEYNLQTFSGLMSHPKDKPSAASALFVEGRQSEHKRHDLNQDKDDRISYLTARFILHDWMIPIGLRSEVPMLHKKQTRGCTDSPFKESADPISIMD